MKRPYAKGLCGAAFALAALAACGGEPASDTSAAAPPPEASTAPAVTLATPVDYSQPSAWLCRPGVEDACHQVATATSVAANGQLTKDHFIPEVDPPIDCFYVYPTVSRDETPNSDIVAGPEEMEIARQQLERFGADCRLYAPLYRQVTLAALREMLAGNDPATDRDMAYADVKAAWERYLASDNQGRGVVLIGHSQGAGLLTRLIASEIDGKPVADRMVSALLLGADVEIPAPGSFTGGSFAHIPLCTNANSFSCVIAYSSFRADVPPPADSLFGKAKEQGRRAACVNPAEIDGSGGELKALLPAGTILFDALGAPAPWTSDGGAIETPFVALPGLLSATCIEKAGFSYLAITVHADPADKRTDTIHGDVMVDGKVQPQWGLHLFDVNLALGNLVDIVKRQGEAWLRVQAGGAAAAEFQPPH